MRILLWMLLFVTLVADAQQIADTSIWKHTVAVGLTAMQVSYTDWAQGAENALSWSATLEGKSLYDLRNYVWTNTYNFGYGYTKLSVQGVRKTDDKIDIASEFKYKLDAYVNPYIAASFKTQFTTGYSYDLFGHGSANSDFLDPAFLIQSAGAGFQPIPEVKTRFGGAVREIVTSTYTKYSGGERIKIQGGLESVTEIDAHLYENLLFKSKLELFAAFETSRGVVVRSDNTLIAKISRYMSTNMNVQFIQEKAISPRTQIKETIALGISYVLF